MKLLISPNMTLKSFRLVMLALVPLLLTNFENTTLELFHKKVISVICFFLSSVPTFYLLFSNFKLLFIPCWLYVYYFSKIIIYWKLTCFSGRCFLFPACVATVTVPICFQCSQQWYYLVVIVWYMSTEKLIVCFDMLLNTHPYC